MDILTAETQGAQRKALNRQDHEDRHFPRRTLRLRGEIFRLGAAVPLQDIFILGSSLK